MKRSMMFCLGINIFRGNMGFQVYVGVVAVVTVQKDSVVFPGVGSVSTFSTAFDRTVGVP